MSECKHEWHVAAWFGPDPFPNWECDHREAVYCEHCDQWAMLEYVEVDDCEFEPIGDPVIFDRDTFCLEPI